MFYLKDGPWDEIDLSRVGNIAFITERLLSLCKKLPDISKSDVPIYTIWLANQLVHFARDTDPDQLELVDGNSKRYKQLTEKTYIFSYDRDMNSDARDDIASRLRKNTRKKK